ncbi:MAG: hypothetical protein NZV14_10350 [Bryobacteraceae bacterium]|nr:hypothetical protein [Bryobacteraceae bacterium]MDW8378553.1 hypothetical protein [Bryobacterales bacterium]
MASHPVADQQNLGSEVHSLGSSARRVAQVLLPSFSDFLFLAVFIWLFATGSGAWLSLLGDADSGWHIRTGDWIRQHRTVPQVDIFSFVKPGHPWFAWEWLTDVIFSVVHQLAGLKGLVLLAAVQISLFGTILFRHMIWRGVTPFVALTVSLLVFGASSIHFLARPHVVTLLALTLSMWLIDADRRQPSARIWTLVPITAVWVNLHGGFLALIACLGLLTVGTMVGALSTDGWVLQGSGWRQAKRYALLTMACGAASLLNPYGWKLHAHIASYLQSSFIKDNVQEFQSPTFRSEHALQFEVMLFLALITVLYLIAKRDFVAPLWIAFWAHAALGSVRHVPLFTIVAAPFVGQALTELWSRWMEQAPRSSTRGVLASLSRDMAPNCRRSSWLIPAAILFFCLAPSRLVRWPEDYPSVVFPVQMMAKYGERLAEAKTLMPDQWADYAIYRHYPKQKVYVDGRSDFFGEQIGYEYLQMAQGHWNWKQLLDKNGFQYVLCPPKWPLSSLLKLDPTWALLADDGQALLFERRAQPPVQTSSHASVGQP